MNLWFKRGSISALTAWYQSSHPRKPLLFRGARQVGKSTLVRLLAQELHVPLHEINLERHVKLNAIFASRNIKLIIQELSFAIGHESIEDGILFLDEIQATPAALAALRDFYEQTSIAVIAAGSLLEFTLQDYAHTMPVGRIQYLYIGPCLFHEYLGAIGQHALAKLLSTWTWCSPMPVTAHEQFLFHFRNFLVIGGMPEAIAQFVSCGKYEASFETHQSILQTYQDDFGKYASRAQVPHLRTLFQYLPTSIGKKFKLSHALPNSVRTTGNHSVELLRDAGLFYPICHSSSNGVPLGAEANTGVFKPIFLDVGLVSSACGLKRITIESLQNGTFVNEGVLAEQWVGQALLWSQNSHIKPRLYYWLREGRSNNAELDYVIEHNGEILPVEVKSGASGSLKSLQQFMALKSGSCAIRLDLNLPSHTSVQHKVLTSKGTKEVYYQLLNLPLYMAEQCYRLLGEFSLRSNGSQNTP